MREPDSTYKQVVLIHPTGNTNVRQAVLALNESRRLAAFHTTVAWKSGKILAPLLPDKFRTLLERRSFNDIPPNLIYSHPWHEAARLLAIQLGYSSLVRNEFGPLCLDVVCKLLDNAVAETLSAPAYYDRLPSAIYGYDGCTLKSFTEAKKIGLKCLFDMPVSYNRSYLRIVEEERELNPDWAFSWTGIADSSQKLEKKEIEMELADTIFVASTYSANALQLCPAVHGGKKIYTIPYGAPAVGPARIITQKCAAIRILYVGSLSQRKGISYLFKSVEQLTLPYTLTIVGRGIKYPEALRDALLRHKWIESIDHASILKLMRECDVLVFPTLTDGFGLVILEAMSQGAVVISTPNSGAPDVIKDGYSGFIVPIQSADAITDILTRLSEDREYLATVSEAARQSAKIHNWQLYRQRWLQAVAESL